MFGIVLDCSLCWGFKIPCLLNVLLLFWPLSSSSNRIGKNFGFSVIISWWLWLPRNILLFLGVFAEDGWIVYMYVKIVLANFRVIDRSNFCWWDTTSAFVRSGYICNKASLLAYRFSWPCQWILVWSPRWNCYVFLLFNDIWCVVLVLQKDTNIVGMFLQV